MAIRNRRFIDIGVNLTDSMFSGFYNGSSKHPQDLCSVLERASENNVTHMIVTGGSLQGSKDALNLVKKHNNLYCTVGCHPTYCNEFQVDTDQYYDSLKNLILNNRNSVVAVGECGLDYDRENFCSRDVQMPGFVAQLRLAKEMKLPLFLHCRAAHKDFIAALKQSSVEESCHGDKAAAWKPTGVVHSYDGSIEHALELINMGFFIGLNGCSLKTEENLAVVAQLPTESILLETDAPWCEIRPTHAGFKYVKTKFSNKKREKWQGDNMVKGRNEPCTMIQVLEVIAGSRLMKNADSNSLQVNDKEFSDEVERLSKIFYENTLRLFDFPNFQQE